MPADGRLTGVLELDAEVVLDVTQRHGAGDHQNVAVAADIGVVLAVLFFLELADDLLEDVLEGDESDGGAELIDDQREVLALASAARAGPGRRESTRRPASAAGQAR